MLWNFELILCPTIIRSSFVKIIQQLRICCKYLCHWSCIIILAVSIHFTPQKWSYRIYIEKIFSLKFCITTIIREQIIKLSQTFRLEKIDFQLKTS